MVESRHTSPADAAGHPRLDPACVIVGAGPAGALLALLLARQGLPVTLLEMHNNFDRDFRGDSLYPGVLEVLDQLGLAQRLLALPHERMETLRMTTAQGSLQVADLRRLQTKFPFVTILRQADFLKFITDEAARWPHFRLLLGANVQRLIEEQGQIKGVAYRDAQGQWQEVRAPLTVAADGRSSRLRDLAGLSPRPASPRIDLLWFRLPRRPGQEGGGFLGPGGYMIVLAREQEWQAGYVIPTGSYQELRTAGVAALREAVARLAPSLADSLPHLTDWQQVKLLSVQASRLEYWRRPGLLAIGDAAHVMSPVGGVGINLAIQDAVEAANVLVGPLRLGRVTQSDLARVQRRREWTTRLIQALQAFDQWFLIEHALRARGPYRLPWWLRTMARVPCLRDLPARLLAFGIRRVHIVSRKA